MVLFTNNIPHVAFSPLRISITNLTYNNDVGILIKLRKIDVENYTVRPLSITYDVLRGDLLIDMYSI